MIIFIAITFLYVIFIYWFEIFQYLLINKLASLCLGGIIFYLLLYNVTYNSDWDMYDAIYMGHTESSDFLFNFISKIFSEKGYDYSSVYKLHIFLIGVGFIYFASRNSFSNVFGIITTYLIFQIVPVSNQIRYYVAFSFFLIAIYNLIVLKNKLVFFVFGVLALISHSAIILMSPFIYFYYTNNEKYIPKLILSSLILASAFYFISFVGFIFSFHFGSYFQKDLVSSFSGGLFNNFIWLFWFLFVYKINKRLLKSNSLKIECDVKYQFLYKISLYSIVFFPVSLLIQVLAHRYIIASLIFWLLFYYYSLNFEESLSNRLLSMLVFIVLILVTFFYMYILPTFLLGSSATEAVFQLFLSNKIFFNNI
ncbi:hypothetical protein DMB65_05330 [Flavobacterium cheongpyeongense]|uniref:EpsG family protein n=1 Tax=Flavobacterium cheongpyeongense TaxID=2212651 RepID=A0A2V4BSF7_9FLAO|nr:EpsG family protein [Flavobacterium cheongpyeongense]PXY41989.1 hypothetical protein DMB65_05330 [Flavobacterium cheongpyeongense]